MVGVDAKKQTRYDGVAVLIRAHNKIEIACNTATDGDTCPVN